MKNIVKKLYYVKREVYANSINEAMKNKGNVYEVVLSDESKWKRKDNKKIGFSGK